MNSCSGFSSLHLMHRWEAMLRLHGRHYQPVAFNEWKLPLGALDIINHIFFQGAPCALLGFYFLCGGHTWTCHSYENMVTCTWGMVIREFQVFKETLPKGHVALRWPQSSLQTKWSYTWVISRRIINWLFMYLVVSFTYNTHLIRKGIIEFVLDFGSTNQWHPLIPERHSTQSQLPGQGWYGWQNYLLLCGPMWSLCSW